MKRLISTLAIAIAATALLPAGVQAAVGLSEFRVHITDQKGFEQRQAGSHPFAMTTFFRVNVKGCTPDMTEAQCVENGKPDGRLRDAFVEQMAGFLGDATAYPRCSAVEFLTLTKTQPSCPANTAVGVALAAAPGQLFWFQGAVFNLEPPPGAAARLGFQIFNQNVYLDVSVNPETNNIFAGARNIAEQQWVFGSRIQLWGNPSDPAHDKLRGFCGGGNVGPVPLSEEPEFESNFSGCSESASPRGPFLTLPGRCDGANLTNYAVDAWENPASFLVSGVPDLADPAWASGGFSSPQFTGCGKLSFDPAITAKPTSKAAQSPTGLDFGIDVSDDGLKNTEEGALAKSQIKKAVVTLPEGFTANPSLAEGLGVCTEAQLKEETAFSSFDASGVGCPNAAKIGGVEVESPLVDESVNGSLYVAEPFKNEFGSLLALYIVIKNPTLGVIVKNKLKVVPDPKTGQLTTTVEDIPQLPFSHFRLHFREGTRSPLATPQACGTYAVKAVLTPWSGGVPITTTSAFEIVSGPNGSPCPKAGLPPFKPGLLAGTINNAAGSYSPFNVRLTRNDGEQEITNFSIKLPPGITGKLAGIPFCPDSAIAAAKARTGPNGGAEELARPSCPAASEIGRSLAGSGVGPSLTYVPGKIYLAGPYHGSALSLVAITAAKAGPFDLGTVVIRFALRVNPETAEVFVDPTGSDPIPHIIQGIQVHLRDIRAYNDRPNFVLNPTNCKRTSTASTLLGSGLDFASAIDDNPVTVSTPFQAADCASLAFKPKLKLNLKGGVRRGANPALKAVLTAKPGEANIASTVVTLPHSAFLDQSHIRTVCTRVQFRAEACPQGAIYGYAKAITPLLDEPLQGPVFLRSSENPLPDLVAHIKNGRITIDLVGRIDSVDGGIRSSFESVPDAPVSKFFLNMQGGKKGLIVNSTNICVNRQRAKIEMDGQNGKSYDTRPRLGVKCKKAKGKAKKSGRAMHARAAW